MSSKKNRRLPTEGQRTLFNPTTRRKRLLTNLYYCAVGDVSAESVYAPRLATD